MSILTLEAKLERQDSTTPWGFRMQGGKDFSSPITIARVWNVLLSLWDMIVIIAKERCYSIVKVIS